MAKREADPTIIPVMQYNVYGIRVDKKTFLEHMSTFGTKSQMTLEEVKKHEITDEPKRKKMK